MTNLLTVFSFRRRAIGLLAIGLLWAQAACQPQATPTVPPSTTPAAIISATPAPTASASPRPSPTSLPSPTTLPSATPDPEISLLFTGVIVPARCVQAGVDARGNADYIYDNVRDLIQSADLAVGTLNATLTDYPPKTGCKFTYVLIGDPINADAMQRAGFDVMSVATNHIKNCGLSNCGNRAFFDTLSNLQRVNIAPVGAGATHDEAMQPVVVTIRGVRFGIVSLGMVEPMAFAGENSPGIAVLNEENLVSAIAAARQVSDVVIAMPHWGPESTVNPNFYQRYFAPLLVRAGADLVVGNHTHVVQALEAIDGVQVFYGLGNFVFDQTIDEEHKQGVILRVRFRGTEYLGYELIPTHVDMDGTVHLAGPEEGETILNRIYAASAKLTPRPAPAPQP